MRERENERKRKRERETALSEGGVTCAGEAGERRVGPGKEESAQKIEGRVIDFYQEISLRNMSSI